TRRRSKENKATLSITRMKAILGSMKMLQESQLKSAALNLSRAGIRNKDAAIAVIFFRLVSPITIGGTAVVGVYLLHWFPEASAFKEYMIVAGALISAYKAPDVYVKNLATKRQS